MLTLHALIFCVFFSSGCLFRDYTLLQLVSVVLLVQIAAGRRVSMLALFVVTSRYEGPTYY